MYPCRLRGCPAIWSELSSALWKGWVLFLLPFLHAIHNQRLPYATLKNREAFPRQHSWCPLLNRQNLEEVGGTGVQWRGKEKEESHLPPPTPHHCFIFHVNGKVILTPALHVDVQSSYIFISLFIPVIFESFPIIHKVWPAHILYSQALGGINIFFFVCMEV